MILRRVKVLEHERALVFKDGAFEGVLGAGRPLDARPAAAPEGRGRVDPQRLAHPPGPRADGALGPAGPRGPRRGPQDPPAGDRLGGRPSRARAQAGRLRAVDGAARRAGRRDRRARARSSSTSSSRPSWRCRAPRRCSSRSRSRRATWASSSATAVHEATLAPGAYALWKGVARAKVVPVDLREQVARRGRPGDHDRRQGHAAPQRGRDLQGGRRAPGRDHGRGLPPGPVPRGAAGAARGRRRADARRAARRQGGGGARARRRAARGRGRARPRARLARHPGRRSCRAR